MGCSLAAPPSSAKEGGARSDLEPGVWCVWEELQRLELKSAEGWTPQLPPKAVLGLRVHCPRGHLGIAGAPRARRRSWEGDGAPRERCLAALLPDAEGASCSVESRVPRPGGLGRQGSGEKPRLPPVRD